jgi:hypothetical protein
MSEFLYLYRGGVRPDSPAEAQKEMERWVNWLKELGARGHVKAPGQPLERTGKVVSGRSKSVTDGPFVEKDMVGGYTLIEAKDLAHATELSMGCPIFDGGGTVEIRPVVQM